MTKVQPRIRVDLAEVRPTLLLEVGEANADAVTELLGRAGYRLHDAADPERGLPEVDRAVWDTLALPTERLDGRLPGRS